ncbi:NADPH-dependent F420 reductase [Haloarcula marina]|uniref:NADPH-dependent F420 reductase n=1 Tax=Haloarcula marina TaxID=2961574 RepID=UPI002113C537|nr:NAD(P)-binding domain-containing protein [Halomicroarcula marina]
MSGMRVGIIGTGSVGSALARGFSAVDHDVVLGSRNPAAATPDLGESADAVEVRDQQSAAAHGDVVVLALPASVVTEVAADLAETLAGKTVVDAANEYPEAKAGRSLAARVADAAPDATVVKAFNTIGANRMSDPVVDGQRATMFVAGAETAPVETLAADLGFDPVVAGDLSAAAHLEHLARFWIHLSRSEGRDIAFRFLRE